MKTLFDGEGRYTDDANRLESSVIAAIKPIFKQFIDAGYCPRSISHAVQLCIYDLEIESVLDIVVPKHPSYASEKVEE